MTTIISEKRLKTIIKDSVREALEKEFMKLRASVLAEVSVREQRDIEKRYSAPSRKRAKSYDIAL